MWVVAAILDALLVAVVTLGSLIRRRGRDGDEQSRWNRLTDLYKNAIMR